jgi:hypothetical protein
MKYTFFILIMLISTTTLLAQTKEPDYTKVSDDILLNYHPDSVALAKLCRIGCVFIKFKVNQQGNIVDLSFSGDADSTQLITAALTKSVNSLKQDIALIDFLKKSNRLIIQPFIYNYQAGCNFPKPGTKDAANYYLTYIGIISDMNYVGKSLYDILKFKDGNMRFFDGVLLNVIGVNNTVMH